jgi:uncharacterized repeat protein (TIGR03803 family)
VLALAVVLLATVAVAAQARKSQTYKEEVLYSFRGSPDGAFPGGGLVRDSAGNLYGTTYEGGPHNFGAVFKLDTTGKETLLHSFADQADGAYPMSVTLILDSAGNLYGTTYEGGGGYGVIFKMDAKGRETVLRIFKQWNGSGPFAGVIRDAMGNVYATTINGGSAGGGVVFKVTGPRKGKVLHDFVGYSYGYYPVAPLVQDTRGNFYGTTTGDNGIVFKLNERGKETVLYTFTGEPDGSLPYAGLILDAEGNLYGTTVFGGTSNYGTVFKLDTTGKETVLYSFTGTPDGSQPGFGSLVMDAEGNLYGATGEGGSSNVGTVFELDTIGKETVLYSFTGGKDGGTPGAGLIWDTTGNLYSTTGRGGDYGYGTVFRLTPQ